MPKNYFIMCSNWRFIPETELYHHGVKGQKWGVRRYQRKDGTLTRAGLKRRKEQYSSHIKLAKIASSIAEKELSSAKQARDEADKRIDDFVDKLGSREPTTKEQKKYDELANDYLKKDHERDMAYGKAESIKSYIKALNNEPLRIYELKYSARGYEYVMKMRLDKKNYSDFWDENGNAKF